MKIFNDKLNRKWEIAVNVASIYRVKAHSGYDVLALATGTLATEMAENPCLMANILWPLVSLQAEEQKITKESFCEGLAGDALESAATAILEEVLDFFPSPSYRAELAARYEAALRVIRRSSSKRIEELTKQETREALEAEMSDLLEAPNLKKS